MSENKIICPICNEHSFFISYDGVSEINPLGFMHYQCQFCGFQGYASSLLRIKDKAERYLVDMDLPEYVC